MFDVEATIVAVATARSEALRGIVRMSGPRTSEILNTLFSSAQHDDLASSRSQRVLSGKLSAGGDLLEVPCDVYFWPNARSYTRQPSAEIHTIGSSPILDGIVVALCSAGARLAAPGEFTMRAFLAGRLDLTQAEAVLGVIDATNQNQLQVALRQLAGGLATPLHSLRERLLDLLAHLEAGLDFVEEDIEFISSSELCSQLKLAAETVQDLVDQIGARTESGGERRVVLRGLPNVGKSSLFNALIGSDRSMVSELASTTRDFLSCRIPFEGHSILLIDTAGVESDIPHESVSGMAQRMSAGQVESADLQLFCLDATRPLTDWEQVELARTPTQPRIIVLTKCDLPRRTNWTGPALATSSSCGIGLDSLRRAVASHLDANRNAESTVVGCTAVRCLESLRRAAECLRRADELSRKSLGEELVAAELRLALDELGAVVGAVYTDDILDRVFGRFCIGK